MQAKRRCSPSPRTRTSDCPTSAADSSVARRSRSRLEKPIKADFAIIKAWKGDAEGNLIYRHTARNFNPMMATAAKLVIAEVEELVPIGTFDPDNIHTPGVFVQRILQGARYVKQIENRTVRKRAAS